MPKSSTLLHSFLLALFVSASAQANTPAPVSSNKDASEPAYPLLEKVFKSGFSEDQLTKLGPKATLKETTAAMTPEQRATARRDLASAESKATTPDQKKEILRGYLVLNEGSPNAGNDALRIAADLQTKNPNDPEAHTLGAGALFQKGDYPHAVQEARAALKLDAADKAAWALLKLSEGRIGPVKGRNIQGVATSQPDPATTRVEDSRPYKLAVKVGPTKAPPSLTVADIAGQARSPSNDMPPAVPFSAGALMLSAGALAWNKWGRQKTEEKADEFVRNAKIVAIGGTLALGAGGIFYGGTLLAGAITATPGFVAAGAGGGTIATGGAVAVNGAALAEGSLITAAGANALHWGRSLMKSDRKDDPPQNKTSTQETIPDRPNNSIKRPFATNPNSKLQRIINELFKPTDTKAGGTSAALREEAMTGKPVGGKWHIQKARDFSRALEDVLGQKDLNPIDRATSQALYDDLQQAIRLWGNRPLP